MTPRLLGSCALRESDIVYSVAAAGNATVAAGTSFGDIKVPPGTPLIMHLEHGRNVKRLQAVTLCSNSSQDVLLTPVLRWPACTSAAAAAGCRERWGCRQRAAAGAHCLAARCRHLVWLHFVPHRSYLPPVVVVGSQAAEQRHML